MFLSWLGRLEEWLISLLLAAMTVVTFVQVVARYLFGYSFSWAFELTTFFFGGVIFIGISYGIRVGAHMSRCTGQNHACRLRPFGEYFGSIAVPVLQRHRIYWWLGIRRAHVSHRHLRPRRPHQNVDTARGIAVRLRINVPAILANTN